MKQFAAYFIIKYCTDDTNPNSTVLEKWRKYYFTAPGIRISD